MSIKEYFGDWLKVIDKAEMAKILIALNNIDHSKLCPKYQDIFRAFNLCKYDECKVIFLGQDPYPQKDVATGILFGNKEGTKDLSPSLEVIKESCINYEIPHNNIEFDVTLESWAKQGILMLNSALTCEVGKVGSHVSLWRPFISKLLKNLSNKETGLIYVLFGTQAKTFKPYINTRYNNILEVDHPSYYARIGKHLPYDIFININKLLNEKYGTTIEWYKEFNNINLNYYEKETNSDLFFFPSSL